jgi:hypothetical protein
MGFNETCAYLHTIVSDAGNGFGIDLDYDAHYCRYFEKKPSVWTLELTDYYLKGPAVNISVDGKAVQKISSIQKIEIPAGLGTHKITIQ